MFAKSKLNKCYYMQYIMKVVRKKSVKKFKIEHNWKLLIVILVLLIFLLSIIWIIVKDRGEIEEIINGDICLSDEDCVPASCCHASECVIKEKAPNCERIFCSAVCSGPLDCGAGSCSCVNNKCEVVPA